MVLRTMISKKPSIGENFKNKENIPMDAAVAKTSSKRRKNKKPPTTYKTYILKVLK